jgi:hypothetical protein
LNERFINLIGKQKQRDLHDETCERRDVNLLRGVNLLWKQLCDFTEDRFNAAAQPLFVVICL